MISVVIPCYNSEKFISRAIESVLKQTFSDYEIIAVNNNSSDNTINIINDYMKRYPDRIKVLHEFKKGAPAARNKGLHEAKGEWIQFLDADDELLADKLKLQMEIAEKSDADIIVGDTYVYKEIRGKIDKNIRSSERDVWKGLVTSKLGITSANLWRKKALLAVNGWDENKSSSQEYDLLFRMIKNNAKLNFCTTPQTIIHITQNSVSNSKNNDRVVEILSNSTNLRFEIKSYLKSKNLLTKNLNRATDVYIYSYLLNYTGEYLWYFKNGKIPMYMKKVIQGNKLDVPLPYIIKIYFMRLKYVIKQNLTVMFS